MGFISMQKHISILPFDIFYGTFYPTHYTYSRKMQFKKISILGEFWNSCPNFGKYFIQKTWYIIINQSLTNWHLDWLLIAHYIRISHPKIHYFLTLLKMKTNFSKVLSNLLLINLIAAILICSYFGVSAQVCSSPTATIYSLSNAGGIYPISVSNANVGTVVNSTSYGSSTSANGIGYNTVNGSFYYFQNAISGTQQFISYNPATNTYATLAPSPMTGTVNKGCVNFNGTGYYCLDNNGNFCYYSIASNTWVLVCSNFTDQFSNNV